MYQHVSFLVGLLSQRYWDSYNIAHNNYTSVTIYIIDQQKNKRDRELFISGVFLPDSYLYNCGNSDYGLIATSRSSLTLVKLQTSPTLT